jgi:hypothetical protein
VAAEETAGAAISSAAKAEITTRLRAFDIRAILFTLEPMNEIPFREMARHVTANWLE